ncbi:hypothetical protein D3C81_269150 [compost metagenome]
MKYVNANSVLPECLVIALQEHVQGIYLYVPVKEGQHKHWGDLSGYRDELQRRNQEIMEKHRNGISIEELSDFYHLSVHAIRKILYQK